MHADAIHMNTRPTVALADYDFLRSTYELLLRAPVPNPSAINAAFDALEAAHGRLRLAHRNLQHKLSCESVH